MPKKEITTLFFVLLILFSLSVDSTICHLADTNCDCNVIDEELIDYTHKWADDEVSVEDEFSAIELWGVVRDYSWTDDSRLTSGSAELTHGPSIAIDSNDEIHIVWDGYVIDHLEPYYKKLDNNGNILVDDKILNSDLFGSYGLNVVADSNNIIHITWTDYRDGNQEIYYEKLDNNGNTLMDDKRLTTDPGESFRRTMAIDSDNNIHMAWEDNRDGNFEIYYKQFPVGATQEEIDDIDDKRLTTAPDNSYTPAMAIDSNSDVHIVWNDRRDGNTEIYYKKLDNSGDTLVDDKRLTTGSSLSVSPAIAIDSNNNVHIVWENDEYSGSGANPMNWEIYYTKLDNSGDSLVDDKMLADSSSGWHPEPSIDVDSKNILHITWTDYRDGNQEIYYEKLDDDGNTLIDDKRITEDSAHSYDPVLAMDSSDNAHMVWYDNRDDDDEIYYKKGSMECRTHAAIKWIHVTDPTSSPFGEGVYSITIDQQGNPYIAGYCDDCGPMGFYAMYTAKLKPDDVLAEAEERVIWEYVIDSSSDDDLAYGIATDQEGYVYLTGTCYDCGAEAGDTAIYTTKLNPSDDIAVGEEREIWTHLADCCDKRGVGIATDQQGYTYVLGYCYGCGDQGDYAMYIEKLNPTDGSEIWTTTIDPSEYDDYAYGIATDQEGNVYVIGDYYDYDQDGYLMYTAKLDPADGSEIWRTTIDPSEYDDYAYGITTYTDQEGNVNVYLAGDSGYCNYCDSRMYSSILIMKLDPTDGSEIWTTTIDSSEYDDGAYGITTDQEGNVYLTGYSGYCYDCVPQRYSTIYTMKLSPDGEKLWAVNGDYSTYNDWGEGIATDQEGNVYVIGDCYDCGDDGGRAFYTMKLGQGSGGCREQNYICPDETEVPWCVCENEELVCAASPEMGCAGVSLTSISTRDSTIAASSPRVNRENKRRKLGPKT